MGNPYASPHLLRPFEYAAARRLRDARAPADRRRPPFPADRRGPGGLSRTWPWSARAIAGSRRCVPGRGGERRARAGSRSSAIGRGVARPSPTSAATSCDGEPLDPQADLPDVQLLHGPDAVQAQRAGPVPHRLPAVRQGGLRADLGPGSAHRLRGLRDPTPFVGEPVLQAQDRPLDQVPRDDRRQHRGPQLLQLDQRGLVVLQVEAVDNPVKNVMMSLDFRS